MSDAKNTEEEKRPAVQNTAAAHVYNPVNMAGKPAENDEEEEPADAPVAADPVKDDYNPVNMAGRKAPLSRE